MLLNKYNARRLNIAINSQEVEIGGYMFKKTN